MLGVSTGRTGSLRGACGRRTLNEVCDALADERDSFTVRVRAYGPDLLLQLLRAVDHVLGPLALHEVYQRRVFHECGNLREPRCPFIGPCT